MDLREIWRRITSVLGSTRYTRAREASERLDAALKDEVMLLRAEVTRQRAENERQGGEIHRLRGENRALLNSILGIAGVPPIPISSADVPPPGHLAPTPGPDVPASGPAPPPRSLGARVAIGGAGGSRALVAPTRRRSWHQINRMLEFESARKTVASDE
jgi:hypothetical protein